MMIYVMWCVGSLVIKRGLIKLLLLLTVLRGTILAKSAKVIFVYLFGRWWFVYMPSNIYDSIRAIKRVLVVCGNIINTLSGCYMFCWQNGCLFTFLSRDNQHKIIVSICMEISKVYGNGLAMLGSVVMCTVYTNKFTFGQ